MKKSKINSQSQKEAYEQVDDVTDTLNKTVPDE